MSKQKKVIINNHYHGGPKGADSHLVRTEKEKKTTEQQTGIKQEDKTIIDYQKAKFEDFSLRANALFRTTGSVKEVMSEQTTYTVYTDAYSTECVAPIAMKWYEKYQEQIPDNFMKFDPVTFIAYCEATLQLVLMSNEEIVGVHGFTRQMVGDAKALLEEWYIPDCVGIAIQGLRPIAIIDSDCKFVLLPYQYQDALNNLINHQVGFQHVPQAPGAPAHFDAVLTPPTFWRREIGQAAQQIPIPGIAANVFRRRSLFLEYMNMQAQHLLPIGMQSVTAALINTFVGHTITSLSCAGFDLFGGTFRRNVVCVRNIYETVSGLSGKLLKLSNVCKLTTGWNTQTFHVARLKDRIPVQISTNIGAGDFIRWMEYEPGEKLSPWFITDTHLSLTHIAHVLMNTTGMFLPVVKPPRQEWLHDERYLVMVDTLTKVVKGDAGPFTALRSHIGF